MDNIDAIAKMRLDREPLVTYQRHVLNRKSTHFFTNTIKTSLGSGYNISHEHVQTYHIGKYLKLATNGKHSNINNEILNIKNIHLKYGGLDILNINSNQLLQMLESNAELFNRIKKVYSMSQNLIIPIYEILGCNFYFIFLKGYSLNININLSDAREFFSYIDEVLLDTMEHNRFKETVVEDYIFTYCFENYTIPIGTTEYTVPYDKGSASFLISLKVFSGVDCTVSIDKMMFLDGSDPINMFEEMKELQGYFSNTKNVHLLTTTFLKHNEFLFENAIYSKNGREIKIKFTKPLTNNINITIMNQRLNILQNYDTLKFLSTYNQVHGTMQEKYIDNDDNEWDVIKDFSKDNNMDTDVEDMILDL